MANKQPERNLYFYKKPSRGLQNSYSVPVSIRAQKGPQPKAKISKTGISEFVAQNLVNRTRAGPVTDPDRACPPLTSCQYPFHSTMFMQPVFRKYRKAKKWPKVRIPAKPRPTVLSPVLQMVSDVISRSYPAEQIVVKNMRLLMTALGPDNGQVAEKRREMHQELRHCAGLFYTSKTIFRHIDPLMMPSIKPSYVVQIKKVGLKPGMLRQDRARKIKAIMDDIGIYYD